LRDAGGAAGVSLTGMRSEEQPPETSASGPPPAGDAGIWRLARESANTIADSRRQRGLPLEAVATPIATPLPKPRIVSRRLFVLGGFWSALTLALIGLAGPSLDFLYPRKLRGFGGPVSVSPSEVPPPGSDPVRNFEGRFWLVNLSAGETPNGEQTEGGLVALWTKCPHLGCTVPWRPDFTFLGRKGWFRCPCHGSTYTREGGVRVFGPAPRSMDTFPLEVQDDGSLIVQTGPARARLGGANNPSRAVPPSAGGASA